MKKTQVYELLNEVTKSVLGQDEVLLEDLSNVVDVGEKVFNAKAQETFLYALVDKIGKNIFNDRVYQMPNFKGLMRDAFEYGSIIQKISSSQIIEANENESWELQDGVEYSQDIYKGVKGIQAKYYNSMVTFEIDLSIPDNQLKHYFSSASEMSTFVNFLYNEVDKSLTIKTNALAKRSINTLIATTLHDDYPSADYTSKSGTKAINLLYLYNQEFGTQLEASEALSNKEFIRFATKQITMYKARMKEISTLFNVGGNPRFTPTDYQRLAVLADFVSASQFYLLSDTYNQDEVKLPNVDDVVPYWQSKGLNYEFEKVSKINLKTPYNDTVEASGILAVLYDKDSCAICNENKRVTSNHNSKAEFTNLYFKNDVRYLIDNDEQCIVFFVA